MSGIWLLTYEVVPTPGNEHFGKAGGAFVCCWIKAKSQAAAVAVAVRELNEWCWAINELTDAKPVNPQVEEFPEESVRFIEQAKVDGSVYCFHHWPA